MTLGKGRRDRMEEAKKEEAQADAVACRKEEQEANEDEEIMGAEEILGI